MQSTSIQGVGQINGGEYQNLRVEGVGTCLGDIKSESIFIEGTFKCYGSVEAGNLICEGVADFQESIRAKKINVDGMLSVHGNAKIEAEEIYCDGAIKTGGEISADKIEADGCLNAREIVGDEIVMNGKRISRLASFFLKDISHIDLIEATKIELCGVQAKSVNGKDVVIGPQCDIDNLDCSGTLYIDRTSRVKNITGSYTRVGD